MKGEICVASKSSLDAKNKGWHGRITLIAGGQDPGGPPFGPVSAHGTRNGVDDHMQKTSATKQSTASAGSFGFPREWRRGKSLVRLC